MNQTIPQCDPAQVRCAMQNTRRWSQLDSGRPTVDVFTPCYAELCSTERQNEPENQRLRTVNGLRQLLIRECFVKGLG